MQQMASRDSDETTGATKLSQHNDRKVNAISLFDQDDAMTMKDESKNVAGLSAVVTPSRLLGKRRFNTIAAKNAVRELFPSISEGVVPVTPLRSDQGEKKVRDETLSPCARRKLIFGRSVLEIEVKSSVRLVYSVVKKLTGSIGGNGSFGPIYGELTMGSMQKMINLMKEHTEFSAASCFIDVGSGIGKPNLHVAQDPGVAFSYGIEVASDRWLLGMNCLKSVLDTAMEQRQLGKPNETTVLQHNCIFEHGDITDARTFDPFTHVYMFSIGFPPKLWHTLSKMWNASSSSYLICYHSPKYIIQRYTFNVELVVQTPTSMHGSKEGHTGYIYQRKGRAFTKPSEPPTMDPFFASAARTVDGGLDRLRYYVNAKVAEQMHSTTRRTRSKLL
jgi:Histone methylation protein DOT1